jgi:hypothetical protein
VVGSVEEGSLEVRIHYVDIVVAEFGVFHHHDYGSKGVVDVAK